MIDITARGPLRARLNLDIPKTQMRTYREANRMLRRIGPPWTADAVTVFSEDAMASKPARRAWSGPHALARPRQRDPGPRAFSVTSNRLGSPRGARGRPPERIERTGRVRLCRPKLQASSLPSNAGANTTSQGLLRSNNGGVDAPLPTPDNKRSRRTWASNDCGQGGKWQRLSVVQFERKSECGNPSNSGSL